MKAVNSMRVLVLVLSLGLAGQTLAGGHNQPPGPSEGPQQMRAMTKMADKLNLTDTQMQDFGALMELYRPRFEEIIKRGKGDREALMAMAPDSPDYPATTEKVSREASRSVGETVTLLSELQGLVYSLLTPEQQVRFMGIREEQRAKMQEMRQRPKGQRSKGMHGKNMHRWHKCDPEAGSCSHRSGASKPADATAD